MYDFNSFRDVKDVDLDSVGSMVLHVSPASIEWTSPDSNNDCVEGYAVCWNSTTFDETYSNCSNLSNDTTSYTLAEDIQVCVEYSASVVVLGTDGQRSSTMEFSFTYTSPNDIDLLVNTNVTVESSSISLEYETSYDYPFCGLNVTGCFSSDTNLSDCISMSGQGGGLDILFLPPDLTMIQSVNVDNFNDSSATISWQPVYEGSPCSSGYSVCYLEENSTKASICNSVDKELNKIQLLNLTSLTDYYVSVGAVFPDGTLSDKVATTFQTSVIEPVSNISVSNATSPAVIKWTASKSSNTCVTGYEVCLNVITLSDSNTTCKNVSKNETSLVINGNTYHCITYNATITTLGVVGLRSEPFYSTQVFLPTVNIDSLINISSNMNKSTILVVSRAFTLYPYCGKNVSYCVSHRNPYSEDCDIDIEPGNVTNNTLGNYSGTSCNLYNITLNLTYYSASVFTILSKTVRFSEDCESPYPSSFSRIVLSPGDNVVHLNGVPTSEMNHSTRQESGGDIKSNGQI
uniref:Fibronectin type-III domain-containing protein n=1 Tax=Timema shepardi TaxID=629360 RepID=A0A7R9G2Z9_TIMSH|nr:unnamed protein product [Timema shepardi]